MDDRHKKTIERYIRSIIVNSTLVGIAIAVLMMMVFDNNGSSTGKLVSAIILLGSLLVTGSLTAFYAARLEAAIHSK